MVKSRMNALDVRASVLEMQSALVGLRLLNIYDLSTSMFVFKFGHGENKKMILVENGVRMHLTELSREKPRLPSQFTLKLRKHVRAWRLSSITQLHQDRTVDMCFGVVGSESCFHILVELFAKGNVILTDHHYVILMLLRTHKDKDVQLVVRGVYPVSEEAAATGQTTLPSRTVEGDCGGIGDSGEILPHATEPCAVIRQDASAEDASSSIACLSQEWESIVARTPDHETIRGILSTLRHLGQSFAEHIMTLAQIKNMKKKDFVASTSGIAPIQEVFQKLLPVIRETLELAHRPLNSGGYLISREKKPAEAAPNGTEVLENVNEAVPTKRYDDFTPVLLAQHQSLGSASSVEFQESFGQVCDKFFLWCETERIQQHNEKNKGVVLSKRQRFELDHQRRIDNLKREEELNYKKGELIILNADRIDQAIDLINGVLVSGIQWDALKALLKRRHAEGHPVAYMIHELLLEKNSISVLLEQELYDDENDADVQPMVVQVDLGKSAHANATMYFGKKKASRVKLDKTIAATGKAAAGASRKGERVAAKQQSKKAIVVERRREWWESLNWFITSAGDVVLQGKDLQTTERLVHKVMRLGDIFVQCDVDGALPCILRPMHTVWTEAGRHGGAVAPGPQPVRARSLAEAGGWCVSRSPAWERKQTVGAWWVYASQITGGTAAGSYCFDGERHHISPQPLSLGVGLLFRVAAGERPRDPLFDSNEAMTEDDVPADATAALHPFPLPDLKTRGREGAAGGPLRPLHPASPTPTPAATTTSSSFPSSAGGGKGGIPTKHQLRKLRKIRARYADQDDEDRRLGALLNGNALARVQQAGTTLNAAKDTAGEEEKREEDAKEEEGSEEGEKMTGEEEEEAVSSLTHEDEAEAAEPQEVGPRGVAAGETPGGEKGEAVVEKDARESASGNPHRGTLGVASEAREGTDGDAVAAKDAEIKKAVLVYTSRPAPEDVVEHAIAVCAPFSTLINYAFRIELGCAMNSKKGQVSKSIVQAFKEKVQPSAKEGESKTKNSAGRKGKDGVAPPSPPIPTVSKSLLRVMESLEPDELVEQLRANVKPLYLQVK